MAKEYTLVQLSPVTAAPPLRVALKLLSAVILRVIGPELQSA